jgi:hypothetical protein
MTVPFSTIIFWSVPLPPSSPALAAGLRGGATAAERLRRAGCLRPSGLFGELPQPVGAGPKSKTNGSTKTVSIVFSNFGSFGYSSSWQAQSHYVL